MSQGQAGDQLRSSRSLRQHVFEAEPFSRVFKVEPVTRTLKGNKKRFELARKEIMEWYPIRVTRTRIRVIRVIFNDLFIKGKAI